MLQEIVQAKHILCYKECNAYRREGKQEQTKHLKASLAQAKAKKNEKAEQEILALFIGNGKGASGSESNSH